MMGRVYYNEIDPFAAGWLAELMKKRLIPDGVIDTRSIVDVRADDLRDFKQCHFFAGIGGWALALERTGLPRDASVWSGSCPCQPFSAAGKGLGKDDPRHLWPHFHRLIRECRPAVVLGEQVEGRAGWSWFDDVAADLEASDYAVGAVGAPACGWGAPHKRQRLYWAGHTPTKSEPGGTAEQFLQDEEWQDGRQPDRSELPSGAGFVADAVSAGRPKGWTESGGGPSAGLRPARSVAHTHHAGPQGRRGGRDGTAERPPRSSSVVSEGGGAVAGFWGTADWLGCRDGK